MKNQKLELTWFGKDARPNLEPRVLVEDVSRSYGSCVDFGWEGGKGNKLIFGDNLLALKALEENYSGSVRCVFIDPPYNTGNAFLHYDDGLEHSIWLGLMRDRLEIIKRLLSADGSLWITIDDNECHYLKVLCDEVFGRANFVANVVWEKRRSRENRRVFSFNHDHILIYAADRGRFDSSRNSLGLSSDVLSRYKNPDDDPRGPWQSVSVNAQAGHATKNQFYKLTLPSGREVSPPKGRCWLYTKEKMQKEIEAGNIWFGRDGDNAPRAKKFLRDYESKGLTPETIWFSDDVGTNDAAKKDLLKLLPDAPVFDNPKPEGLIERIIHIATNPGDLVLDSFAGSGTTGAVAHKMGRRWIMVELGEHCHTHIIPRLKKVIDGEDPGGITKAVNWQGGGGFRYYRLAPTLIVNDRWGNPVINPDYNAVMLAEALAKLEGFTYAPSDTRWWQHGHSSERDFIYVTTQNLSAARLQELSDEVGPEQSLLVCCSAFHGVTAAQAAERWTNLTLKKIPKMVLARCEWGKDDYSLNVANLPMARPEEPESTEPPTGKSRRRKKVETGTPDLFGHDEQGGGHGEED